MNNDANTICIVIKFCMSLVIWQVIVHAKFLDCSLFIVHWPHFIVPSFHYIVQPDVQHVVHNTTCAIVHNFKQFAPTPLNSPEPLKQLCTVSVAVLLYSFTVLYNLFLVNKFCGVCFDENSFSIKFLLIKMF